MVSAFFSFMRGWFSIPAALKQFILRKQSPRALPDPGPGRIWLGGDAPTIAATQDQHGKTYRFHRLLTEGPYAGMYEPIFYLKMGPTTDAMQASEARDIWDSGLTRCVLDKETMVRHPFSSH